MNSLKNVYELIDISSSEDESQLVERSSTPLPRETMPNYRVILKNSLSSAEAVADEEEYFDVSADSLEASYKRIRLNSSLSSIDSSSYPQQEGNVVAQAGEEIPDSPESPDESMSSDVFVVEEATNNEPSFSSSKVAEYLEKVYREDSSSYFVTPLGIPRKINFTLASPLNDLEARRSFDDSEETEMSPYHLRFCQDNQVFSPEEWPCHSPLPDWIVSADEWGSEEAMGAAYDSPNGILITNLKTLNSNLK